MTLVIRCDVFIWSSGSQITRSFNLRSVRLVGAVYILSIFPFQDVVLHRSSSQDKLGLTLCYENNDMDDDDLTDVYVSEVL